MAEITGMTTKTVRRGKKEFFHFSGNRTSRVRRPGGGRKRVEATSSRLVRELDELLMDTTAGDPVTGMKWTHKSVRKVQLALRRCGIRIGRMSVARLLHQRRYSLRTNRKTLAGTNDPDRDRQFRYLTRVRRWYISHGIPVVSIDAKKKEKIGNFKNPGTTWRRNSREVLDHDFMRYATGIGVPFGIYDLARNDGYIVVGVSQETSDFDVNCLRRWWIIVGRRRYPDARRLLIEADCGGGNSNKAHGFDQMTAQFSALISSMIERPL
jgi:transposase